jgi:N-glycosylase/DNA lyase
MKKDLLNSLKTNPQIEKRLKEFKFLGEQGHEHWFSELCFCILTANSKALTAIAIQNELGPQGFIQTTQAELAAVIRKSKHRFHNTKANYIVEARKFINIKSYVSKLSGPQARTFIVKNIKGLGYKEASHFLRNVGFDDVAIIDRHILRYLFQKQLIAKIPQSLSTKIYIEFEQILSDFGIALSRLDLIIWEQMTGKILK